MFFRGGSISVRRTDIDYFIHRSRSHVFSAVFYLRNRCIALYRKRTSIVYIGGAQIETLRNLKLKFDSATCLSN